MGLTHPHDNTVVYISKMKKPVVVPPGGVWSPWSTFSVKFQKVWIRMDRIGPGGPRGPQPTWVDQERSGPPWTMLRHFPDATSAECEHGVEPLLGLGGVRTNKFWERLFIRYLVSMVRICSPRTLRRGI